MSLTYPRIYRHLLSFLIGVIFVFSSVRATASSITPQTAAALLYAEYGTASGYSVTAVGTALTINLTPGGNQLINDAVGGAAVVIGAAGTQVISSTAAGVNSLWLQATTNQCAISPSSSVCANTGRINYPSDVFLVGTRVYGGRYGDVSEPGFRAQVASNYTGSAAGAYTFPPLNAYEASVGYVSTLGANGNGTEWRSVPTVEITHSDGSPSLPPVVTPADIQQAVSSLTPTQISAAASISSPTPLPGSDIPSVLVTAPPGTTVYTPAGVLVVPSTGSLSVPNPAATATPAAAGAAAATAAGTNAAAAATAAGATPAAATAAAVAATNAYTAAVAAGATPAQSTVAATAAAAAATNAYTAAAAAGATPAAATAAAATAGTAAGTNAAATTAAGTAAGTNPPEKFPDINIPDLCPDCTKTLDNRNFFTYARDKFSTKFPFDVIGDLTSLRGGGGSCTKQTFWGHEHEICFVRDLTATIRFPVAFSWLVYLVTHL